MSESNPFAFTGLNVPRLPSSEANLRAESARWRQNVAMLQREVEDLKDANGIAQAVAAAKSQVQEAQRESQRAQIAERIARAALDAVRNTRNMSQDSSSGQSEISELRKKLWQSEAEKDELQEELKTCKGDLAKKSAQLDETNNEFDALVSVELKAIEATNNKQQTELQDVRSRLNKTTVEVEGLHNELDETRKSLESACDDNARLAKELNDHKTYLNHLSELNDNFIADLAAKEAQRKTLARERDDFELRLTETLLALKDKEESETEARNELESFQAETQLVADELNEQIASLQVDMDTTSSEIGDHERVVALMNERITHLAQENEVLQSKLDSKHEEEQAYSPMKDNVGRPRAYRSVSTFSHISLADEMRDAESDDEESLDALSNFDESVAESVDLGLSDVLSIINITPQGVSVPHLTLSVGKAVSTIPERQDSLIEHSPVSSISDIEPVLPAGSGLSIYNNVVADFSPSEPAVPTMSLSDLTEESVSPSEPRNPLLLSSNIRTILDRGPAEPTILTPATTPEPQELSSYLGEALNYSPVEPISSASATAPEPRVLSTQMVEQAGFSIAPSSGAVVITNHFTTHNHDNATAHTNDLTTHLHEHQLADEPSRTGLATALRSPRIPSPPRYSLEIPRETNPRGLDLPYIASRRRRSPMDPFARHGQISDTESLNKVLTRWPLEDTTQEEPTTLLSTPPSSPSPNYVTPEKWLGSSGHYVLHLLTLVLAIYCWRISNQLYEWEHANGHSFGEGYGDAHDRYGPYGNGHALLSMLPLKLLSADSPLPAKAVEVITSTVSAFESWIGAGPTPHF